MPAIRSSRRGSTTRPAPTSSASSTSPPLPTTATRSTTWCSARPRPASCRSPSAAACGRSRTSAACCSPAPTRSRSTPRRSRIRTSSKQAAREIRRPMHRGLDRRQGDRAGELRDLHPWRPRGHRHRRGRLRPRMAENGAGELLVTSMDRDGTRAGYNLALTRAIADAVTVPVIASGGVGTSIIWSKASARAMRPRCWPHPFSILAPIRSPRPKHIWPRPACRCGW